MKPQVLFYYPQHFNRSAEGTNPFFDRLLETCDKNGISYRLYEEPDYATDKPRNPKAKKADLFYWTVWFVRKVVRLFNHADFYEREKVVARIVNCLTLGRWRVPVYITISGSMYHLFAEINPNGKVYDMQHGVLMKSHITFFDENERLRPQFYQKNLHWLMWGNGYKDLFERGEESILQGRVHTVGYPIPQRQDIAISKEKVALMSLQLTHDWDAETLQKHKSLIDEILSQFDGSGYKVLLRHHPRFNNVIDISDIISRYDFVDITKESFDQLVRKVSLHVTFTSTTAFEYAQYGIPTIFMSGTGFPQKDNMMYREFKYPLFLGKDIKESIEYLQDNDTSGVVKKWYEKFYSPFDEKALLRIVCGKTE